MSLLARGAKLAALLLALAASSAVYADIGGIGSPVVPSNAPAADSAIPDASPATQPEIVADATAQKPRRDVPQLLLVMRFDIPHPNLESELKEAIQKNQSNAFYQLVSYVPNGAVVPYTQDELDGAAANLAHIAQKLQDLGIPGNQMQVGTKYSGLASYQEVFIFVY